MTGPGRADLMASADRLFDRLLDLPPSLRPAALEAWCGGDHRLRAIVADLLQRLETPAAALDPSSLDAALRREALDRHEESGAPGLCPGDRVGRWRVLSELGQGGMGTVYLVSRADGVFEQRAALKLARHAPSDEDVRQFERERQILATLSHAPIARLLDGGETEDGRPYLLMEHVEGRSVTAYADAGRLTVDQRLELFVRIAAAIEHAHQRLVVHRDIKPANIAVTAEHEVKVLDFGIASLLVGPQAGERDPAPRTRVLTPDYASPEDVTGAPVSTASDIYQLGLLLYELLTGEAAQRVGEPTRAALEEAVCRRAIELPSERAARGRADAAAARGTSVRKLVRQLSGDLDAITGKALDKAPERRYQAVGELVADVLRYRRRLPVKASGDEPVYRLRTFVRRHRRALAWSGAAGVAATWLVAQAGEQRLRAGHEAARTQQVERILGGLFESPTSGSILHAPVARDYLDQAVRLVRRDLAGEPAGRARLLDRLASVYIMLGLYEDARGLLEESLPLHRTASGADGVEAAQSLGLLGQSQHYLGQYEEAETSLREALRIRRLRFGSRDRSAVLTSLDLADLLHTRGDLIEAERLLREAVGVLEEEADVEYVRATATRALANVLRDRGLLAEAEVHYRNALQLLADHPQASRTDVAMTELFYARLLTRAGRLDEADRVLASSLRTLRTVFDGDHPLTGMALRNLGYLRTSQGRLDEAGRALAESEAVLQAWLGPTHPMVSRTHAHMAALSARRGNWADAAARAGKTLDEFAMLHLEGHPAALDSCVVLGQARLRLGQPAEVLDRLAVCADTAARLFVQGDERTRDLRTALADARLAGERATPARRPITSR